MSLIESFRVWVLMRRTLTRDDFLRCCKAQTRTTACQLSERDCALFRAFDLNSSGKVTIGEFKSKVDARQMGTSVDDIGALSTSLIATETVREVEYLLPRSRKLSRRCCETTSTTPVNSS